VSGRAFSARSREKGIMHTAKGLALILAVAALSSVGCGGNNDEPYKPMPAWSGKKASIPAPPSLPTTPMKVGDAFTIYGAQHHMRSLIHSKEVTSNPISIVGYIVDTNITRAPECAIHDTGKKDPDSCVDIPIPSFWIADNKGDMKGPKIRVLGWARNFAVVWHAMWELSKSKDGKDRDGKDLVVMDDILNVPVPFPLPNVGAKVKITGHFGVSYRGGSDMVADPQNGVLTYNKIEYLEPPPEVAHFPKELNTYPHKGG
jgi:hypothetical protein